MTSVQVEQLTFNFPTPADVEKYDTWSFYRNQFQSICGGSKAIDLLFIANDITWFIEVKDYRNNRRSKPQDLGDEIAQKVRDTVVGLAAAKNASNSPTEKSFANRAIASSKYAVVFHLEQPVTRSRLFPQIVKPADLVQQLKQRLKAISPHPKVVDKNCCNHLPWNVT